MSINPGLYMPTKSWEEAQPGTLSQNTCVLDNGLNNNQSSGHIWFKRVYLQADLVAEAEECCWIISPDKPAVHMCWISPLSLNTHNQMEICKQLEEMCLLSESIQCFNKSK